MNFDDEDIVTWCEEHLCDIDDIEELDLEALIDDTVPDADEETREALLSAAEEWLGTSVAPSEPTGSPLPSLSPLPPFLEDINTWCDEHLPELYDVGMFDSEVIAGRVWSEVDALVADLGLDIVVEETLREAAASWFAEHHTATIATVDAAGPFPLDALLSRPQVDQHTADWYAQRAHRLTASEFYDILTGSRETLLRSKVTPAIEQHGSTSVAPVAISHDDGEMVATSWGHRFEPVIRDIYELETSGVGTVCDTLGRFTHATIPWLSASPDGVVLKGALGGRLVEIKAPKSREPGEFVPERYFAQMQIQMEVTDLPAVDFIEAKFAQCRAENLTDEQWDAIRAARWKGRIEVYGSSSTPSSWKARYTAPVEDLEDAVFKTKIEGDEELLESSIWWLVAWYPRTVLRNAVWWDMVGWPAAKSFWDDVEARRLLPVETTARVTVERVGWLGRSYKEDSCSKQTGISDSGMSIATSS